MNIVRSASDLTEKLIRNAMILLDETELMLKIGNYQYGEGTDFVAMEVHYHNYCKQDMLNKANTLQHKGESNERKKAFELVVSHIRSSVIEDNKPELASDILRRYQEKFVTEGGNVEKTATYTIQNLCKKLSSHFAEELATEAEKTKKTVV